MSPNAAVSRSLSGTRIVSNTTLRALVTFFDHRIAICLYLAIFLVCAWNLFAVWRVFSLAHVPDELWFYIVALENYRSAEFNPIFAENKFGYGGVWFALYHCIISLCEIFLSIDYSKSLFHDSSSLLGPDFEYGKIAPLWLMRAISFFSINWIFFFYIRRLSQGRIWAFFSLVLFLSFTMLYWGGKIASPDILSCVLLFAGVWSFRNSRLKAYILFGLALGMKLSVVPVVATLVIFHLIVAVFFYASSRAHSTKLVIQFQRQKLLLDLYIGLTLCLGIFFVCNLYAVSDSRLYIDNIVNFSSAFSPDNEFSSWSIFLNGVKHRLNNQEGQLWDLVNPGGFFYWSSGAPIIALAFYLAFYLSESKINAVFFTCCFFVTLAFLVRQPAFGWNWFPLISIFPLIISFIRMSRVSVILLLALCALSFFLSIPNIKREVTLVHQHRKILSDFLLYRDDWVAETDKFLEAMSVDEPPRILNLIDIGIVYPGAASFNDSYWIHKDKVKAGDLILVGDRIKSYHDWLLPDIRRRFETSEQHVGHFTAVYLRSSR